MEIIDFDGHSVRHLRDLDFKCITFTKTNQAFGELWRGDRYPTLIRSSQPIANRMIDIFKKPIVPAERNPDGFKFMGADWIADDRLSDGKVLFLNEKCPMDPTLNGYFVVG